MDERVTARGSEGTCFVTLVRSERGEQLARIVIEGLRAFGGPLHDCPVWVFSPDTDRAWQVLPGLEDVRRLPLTLEVDHPPYPFAEKVYACAQAEEMAGPEVRSSVWLSLDCLIVNPPVLFDLAPSPDASGADAAFRPVHHRNVGSLAQEPLNDFWQGVYRALGVEDMDHAVESFVDRETLRPYFNTHSFALNPEVGLARVWWDRFATLITDAAFQAGPCDNALHKIFLHQAILSTLVAQRLDWARVRLLPPEYNYPLNLLDEIPPVRRAARLNDLVTAVYEDAFPWGEIEVREPLLSWLRRRLPE